MAVIVLDEAIGAPEIARIRREKIHVLNAILIPGSVVLAPILANVVAGILK